MYSLLCVLTCLAYANGDLHEHQEKASNALASLLRSVYVRPCKASFQKDIHCQLGVLRVAGIPTAGLITSGASVGSALSRAATCRHHTARGAGLEPHSAPPRAAQLSATVPRRHAMHSGLITLAGFSTLFVAGGPATAFDNAIPEYAEYKSKPKRAGTPPKDLGIAKRTILDEESLDVTFQGLRGCDGLPNCFSTTGDVLKLDRLSNGVDTLIKPWKPPADDKMPFKSLVKVIKDYPPGQGYIDGGGFKIVKETDSYIYLQFESLKKGYIDDAEWLLGNNGMVMVRSSSRVGQLDFRVNARRLNYIAAQLRKQGWTIDEIDEKGYKDYFERNADALDETYDPDRRKGTELENARVEKPLVGLR